MPLISPNTLDSFLMLNKVPEVSIYFWLDNLMAATVGETAVDYLFFNAHFMMNVVTVLISIVLLIVLLVQFSTRKYLPWVYWMCVVLISVLGTLITNKLIDNSGISLEVITLLFGVVLIATFFIWHLIKKYSIKKTLSAGNFFTNTSKLFYWIAALVSLVLGTVAGSIVVDGWLIRYGLSTFASVGMVVLTAMAYYVYRTNILLIF